MLIVESSFGHDFSSTSVVEEDTVDPAGTEIKSPPVSVILQLAIVCGESRLNFYRPNLKKPDI
jgi:hypothetical protein